jgi:hypothetical protein
MLSKEMYPQRSVEGSVCSETCFLKWSFSYIGHSYLPHSTPEAEAPSTGTGYNLAAGEMWERAQTNSRVA